MAYNPVLVERLTRNFERRMGKSMMPLLIKYREGYWRVVDTETGSWVDYTTGGFSGRLRRVREQDNG